MLGQTHEQKLVVPSRKLRESVSPTPLLVIESVSGSEPPSPSESQTPVSRRRVSWSPELREVQSYDPALSPSVVPKARSSSSERTSPLYLPLKTKKMPINLEGKRGCKNLIKKKKAKAAAANSGMLAQRKVSQFKESEIESESQSTTPSSQLRIPVIIIHQAASTSSEEEKEGSKEDLLSGAKGSFVQKAKIISVQPVLTRMTGQATEVPVGLEETEQDPEEKK